LGGTLARNREFSQTGKQVVLGQLDVR